MRNAREHVVEVIELVARAEAVATICRALRDTGEPALASTAVAAECVRKRAVAIARSCDQGQLNAELRSRIDRLRALAHRIEAQHEQAEPREAA